MTKTINQPEEHVPAAQMFRRALEKTLEALQAMKDAHHATIKAHGFSASTEGTLFDSVVPVVDVISTMLARNVAFVEEQDKKWLAARRIVSQLDEDAPAVPPGLILRDGVEYGCHNDACRDCYEGGS
jgi:hypothetical protein